MKRKRRLALQTGAKNKVPKPEPGIVSLIKPLALAEGKPSLSLRLMALNILLSVSVSFAKNIILIAPRSYALLKDKSIITKDGKRISPNFPEDRFCITLPIVSRLCRSRAEGHQVLLSHRGSIPARRHCQVKPWA